MGDLSRTVSESLGDFLQKWGIPAIPRPRINTDIPVSCSWQNFREAVHFVRLFHVASKMTFAVKRINEMCSNTLDVCICTYTCTLGANSTLSTLMSDFFRIGRMDFLC